MIHKKKSKDTLLKRLIRKYFKFNDNIRLTDIEFKLDKAVKEGSMFRICGTIYYPTCPPPHTDKNWYIKICAVVIFGVKVLSFTAINLDHNKV